MKRLILCCLVGLAASLQAGSRPVLSSVTSANAGSYLVVSYTVDKPCVVTFAILTNGVPLAAEWTATGVTGEIFRRVTAGTHSFRWKPRRSGCPEFTVDPAFVRVKAWAVDNPPDYVVFDLTDGCSARYYEAAEQLPGGVTNAVYKTTKLVMRKIPAANETFRMGTPSGAVGRQSNEIETHVTFTNDFYLGIYELTEGQNARFYGNVSGSRTPVRNAYTGIRGTGLLWPGDGHAVDEGSSLLAKARELSGGLLFDLPTRAQWQFACRAGSSASLYTGEELTFARGAADSALDEIAWYGYNSGAQTVADSRHEVGLKKPNAWGLYDMLGNVWEWVLDWYQNPKGGTLVEPVGVASDTKRQRCGGAYDSEPYRCRCASESSNDPSYSNDWQSGVNGKCNTNQGCRLWLPAVAER